jgi:hypothetical protein
MKHCSAAHPHPRPRRAVEPRNVTETTKVAFVGGMMAGSDRLAVFPLLINWPHSCEGDQLQA